MLQTVRAVEKTRRNDSWNTKIEYIINPAVVWPLASHITSIAISD